MSPPTSPSADHAHAWQGHASWCVTHAKLDLPAFLATWHAWALDPQRPQHLHVVAFSDSAESVHAACRAATSPSGPPMGVAVATHLNHHEASHLFSDFAQQVAQHCWGLLPGMHRLRLAQGHVTLTLCIGDSPEFAEVLRQHPTGPCRPPVELGPEDTRTVTIIGAGISGAGTARALAERGWHVTVLDVGSTPAAGASGLPVGVIAPHTSHDDSAVSRLTRAGVRLMRHILHTHLREGTDWAPTGVLERRLPGKTRRSGVPLSWLNEHTASAQHWTQPAPPPAPDDAYWHAKGAWLRPAQLVRALLEHPNIRWQGHAHAEGLRCVTRTRATGSANHWQVMQGHTVLAESARVVIAAGPGSAALVASATQDGSSPRINPLRGQISWGLMADVPHSPISAMSNSTAISTAPQTSFPVTPVNGNGAFVHSVPTDAGPAWFVGSTYDRLQSEAVLKDSDHADNFERLQTLHPDTAAMLAPLFAGVGHSDSLVHGWAGVRCGVHDRLPISGPVHNAPDGLYLNTAMGSRGLTLALLCGELMAAQWHGEPLPIEARLVQFLEAARFKPKLVSAR